MLAANPLRTVLSGALAASVALAGAGCEDGSHVLREVLEEAPVIPKPPQAVTSPVSLFAAEGTPFAAPADAYGALGPAGLALVRSDGGESTSALALEDSDALVCDPSRSRVLLLKARAHQGLGQAPAALVFATSSGGSLDGAADVLAVEASGAPDRVLVATAAGYTVLDEAGGVLGVHAIAGAPFSAAALNELHEVLYLAAGSEVRRVHLESGHSGGQHHSDLSPADQSASPRPSELLYTGAAPIAGLTPGANDDLLFCEGNRLRRIPDADSSAGSVVLTVITFAPGEVARGVVLNSARNAVVAIDATGVPGAPAPGRLVEVSLSGVDQPEAAALSSVSLPSAPRALAIDGRHASIAYLAASGARTRLEAVPDLKERIQPIFDSRGCIGCHPVVAPQIDLTSPENAHATLVGQAPSAACLADDRTPSDPATPGPLRVTPGDPAASLIIQKLMGLRDGSAQALNGLASCGSRMPQALRPIPEVEIDTIRKWIEGGAPEAAH